MLCLPVPEKAQRQFSYCIIPQYGDGITTAPEGTTTFEPMVWTVADAPPRTAFLGSGTPVMESASLAEKNQTYLQGVLDERLKGVKVTCPDAKEFSCAKPESHRKDEKAYHVKAFRGSKEGEYPTISNVYEQKGERTRIMLTAIIQDTYFSYPPA